MTGTPLDLSLVPAPDAILPVDHAALVADMKAQLIAALPDLAPALALESEPLVKLIEVSAFQVMRKVDAFNHGVRAMLLPLAVGADLDNVASNLAVQRLAGETDEAFRQRAALGPEGWASAGPVNAYRFHALSASPLVADVAVSSPAPGQVRVVILSTAVDGVATPALLDVVDAALNAEDVRPLTDQVTVVSAGVASYDVTATAQILGGPDAGPVAGLMDAALRAYAAGRRRLNRAVTRNGIIAALMQAGVENLVLASPAADIPAEAETAPVLDAINLTLEIVG